MVMVIKSAAMVQVGGWGCRWVLGLGWQGSEHPGWVRAHHPDSCWALGWRQIPPAFLLIFRTECWGLAKGFLFSEFLLFKTVSPMKTCGFWSNSIFVKAKSKILRPLINVSIIHHCQVTGPGEVGVGLSSVVPASWPGLPAWMRPYHLSFSWVSLCVLMLAFSTTISTNYSANHSSRGQKPFLLGEACHTKNS